MTLESMKTKPPTWARWQAQQCPWPWTQCRLGSIWGKMKSPSCYWPHQWQCRQRQRRQSKRGPQQQNKTPRISWAIFWHCPTILFMCLVKELASYPFLVVVVCLMPNLDQGKSHLTSMWHQPLICNLEKRGPAKQRKWALMSKSIRKLNNRE